MYNDIDGGNGIYDNRSGNSDLVNPHRGIPNWVPFHFGGSNKRYYMDWKKMQGKINPKSAFLPVDVKPMFMQYVKK